jgi:NADPH-dependent 2,4-dienoyl-CoA reductase/sulfur reductase-like enzyme
MKTPNRSSTGASSLDRRRFTATALGATALGGRAFGATTALIAGGFPSLSFAKGPRVVIVGAGAGGATVARHLSAQLGGQVELVVVSGPSASYVPPFLGKPLLLGESGPVLPPFEMLFAGLKLSLVAGTAMAIDRSGKTLKVRQGSATTDLAYDILVAAPGVALKNYGGETASLADPHGACWTADGACNAMIAGVDALPQGGRLTVIAPPQPFRCPPAIYERVCLLAHRLTITNPGASILILDEKDRYPMQALFEAAYSDYYEDMIEWVPLEFHGGVTSIDFENGLIETDFESFRSDFIHAVPPQVAPDFLTDAGLGDDHGYCPIEAATMRSGRDQDIYIVGDASAAGEMSKSAGSAIVQGKLAAVSIGERITGRRSDTETGTETEIVDKCWSFVAPDDAVRLGGRYRPAGDHFAALEHFTSNVEDPAEIRQENAREARLWSAMILSEIYGVDL